MLQLSFWGCATSSRLAVWLWKMMWSLCEVFTVPLRCLTPRSESLARKLPGSRHQTLCTTCIEERALSSPGAPSRGHLGLCRPYDPIISYRDTPLSLALVHSDPFLPLSRVSEIHEPTLLAARRRRALSRTLRRHPSTRRHGLAFG